MKIIQHCAVFGELTTIIQTWEVHGPRPYAQYDVSADLRFKRPRKKLWNYYTIVPDNLRWATVEDDTSQVLWDSRTVVPCDMVAWQASRDRHLAERKRHEEQITAAVSRLPGLKFTRWEP